MSKNTVKNTCDIIYPAELARQLKVTDGAVRKAQRKNYFPSDWFERIVILTDGRVTFQDLYADLYLHKYGIIPEVLLSGIYKYLVESNKSSADVRKHRQAAS
jgi:hypothetical protein